MTTLLKKLETIIDRSDVRKLLLLMIPVTILSLLEVLGIFSILPFMKIVSDPGIVDTDPRFQWFYTSLGFTSHRSLLIWMGFGVLFIYFLTGLCTIVSGWLIHRYIWGLAHRISMKLLHRYSRQPYEYFLTRSSADMVKKAVADIHSLVSGVLKVGCVFFANTVKSSAILILLLIVDFRLSMTAFLIFGGTYLIIHLVRHRYLEQLGRERLDSISERLKSFSEALSGIKTIRVSGATDWFVQRFEKASKKFCDIQPKFQLFTLIPKSLIEFLAFGGIIAIVLSQLLAGGDLAQNLPVLSVFAVATYKLLPALNQAFAQAAILSHNLPVVDEVYQDMQDFHNLHKPIEEFKSAKPLDFSDGIQVKNVSYQYESSGLAVLNEIDLTIARGRKCAFVGTTGCGKSTLVDIMAGLHFPTSGQLLIDSTPVSIDNAYSWQKRIAYVPQEVFLYDDTIAANIALGVEPELIDRERLEKSARLAQVVEFLDAECREGYETVVGEHGVRLSGGQRQRIGLARVFYQEPDVLFLDEATSALDSITEEAIVSAIEKEFPDVTVVMVAHRLSSTRFCDIIFMMDEGRIVASGSFDELVQTNKKFRQMVEVNE